MIRFVRAQPVPLWKVGAARWLIGSCVLVFPLICVGLICLIAEQVVGVPNDLDDVRMSLYPTWNKTVTLIAIAVAGMAACLNLYAWIVAISVNQPTELRAGLCGALITVALFIAGMVGLSGWDNHLPDISALHLMSLISCPLVWMGIPDFVRNHYPGLVTISVVWQLILTAGLFTVMVVRYGREERWITEGLLNKTRAASTDISNLRPPISSPWRALFWLQLRQSIPVCAAGMAITLLLAIAGAGFSPGAFDGLYPTIGCVLALLIGIGSYVPELQRNQHTFWRSRPIPPSSWFWFKFIGGAFALVAVFDLPCVVLAWTGMVHTSSRGIAAFFPALLHLLCYSLAVLAACSVRHSTYGGVFAVGGLLVILILPEMAYIQMPFFLSFFHMWGEAASAAQATFLVHLLPACILVGVFAFPATLTAAYLIKRDISLAS